MRGLSPLLCLLACMGSPAAAPCKETRLRADAFPGLEEALQAASRCAGPITLIIDDTAAVRGNLTVPGRVDLRFEAGGRLFGKGEASVTILGNIESPNRRIFENVKVGFRKPGPGGGGVRNAFVVPQWWGAVADDDDDDAPALTDALMAAWSSRRTLMLPGGTYLVSRPVAVSGDGSVQPASWDKPLWIRGDDAILQGTPSNAEGVMRIEAATPDRGGGSGPENKIINGRINISGVFFQAGRDRKGYGLRVYGANGLVLSNLRFKDFGVGLQIWNVDLVTVRDTYFEQNAKGLEQRARTRMERLQAHTGEGANSWTVQGNFFLVNDTALHLSTGTGIRIESNEFATHEVGILLGALEGTRHGERIETAVIRSNRFESDHIGRGAGRHHILVGNRATKVKNVLIELNDFIAQNGGSIIHFDRTDRWCVVRDNRISGPPSLVPLSSREGEEGGRRALWVTAVPVRSGRVEVKGLSTLSDTVWFKTPGGQVVEQFDPEYQVIATPQATTGGKAHPGAYVVIGVRKTVKGFVVETSAAPGAGKAVTFDWVVLRDKGDVSD